PRAKDQTALHGRGGTPPGAGWTERAGGARGWTRIRYGDAWKPFVSTSARERSAPGQASVGVERPETPFSTVPMAHLPPREVRRGPMRARCHRTSPESTP